ncbi:DUF2520 domain-containing protein [Leucobacter sp. GX24907]
MRIQIVGHGRVASAVHAVLLEGGLDPLPLAGRGADGAGSDLVLLAVPDAAIGQAAAKIAPGPVVGHCSGALPLDVLGERECFSMHPLLPITGAGIRFDGAFAAVDGSTERARSMARELAEMLGLRTFAVAAQDRSAYHASASIASNLLVVLEGFAERLAATAGVPREALVPLVRATVQNWADLGAERALTGPIVRGDEETVDSQREAVVARLPEALESFDALVDAARQLLRSSDAGEEQRRTEGGEANV